MGTPGPKQSNSGFLKTPPVMSEDMSYHEWKSEVELWSQITEVPKKKQGGSLFFTLQGDARDTIRSKLTNTQIAADNGLDTILKTLDELYLKDSNQRSFSAYEEFINYRRAPGISIKDFIIQFNIKYNKIKSHDMELPEGVLAYNLLVSANLSEEQQQLCRATVSKLTYDGMKNAIEKVAVSHTSSNSANFDRFQPLYNQSSSQPLYSQTFPSHQLDSHYDEPEENFYTSHNQQCYYNDATNDDGCKQYPVDQYPEETFYSQYRSAPNFNRGAFSRPHSHSANMNPKDEFGRPTTCSFCHSIFHWIQDCPHAPKSDKFDRGRSQRRGSYRVARGGRASRGRQL